VDIRMSRNPETVLSGTIIHGDDFQPFEGYLCVRDGIIKEIGTGLVDSELQGIICPRFVNAHTHIGDSAFKDPPFLPLSELVGPGGLKHQLLANTPRAILVESMRRTLLDMIATGTFAFADFREGGPEGVEMLIEALEGLPLTARILGRPDDGSLDIHCSAWGLGISSTRDHELEAIRQMANGARYCSKAVAIHAGEAGTDDISEALSLNPDFLVHLSRASREDLRRVAASGVPVVVCPRSNLVTGAGLPDVQEMIDLGITVGIGTDNVMLNSPNMFSEMELVSKALLHDDRQVFKMCTLNGAKIMGIDEKAGSISEGKEARLMVIDKLSDNMWGSSDLLASVVRRARPSDILAIF
jgi:cytosine/adenosine deaminase-related metal-dependent hydrolase